MTLERASDQLVIRQDNVLRWVLAFVGFVVTLFLRASGAVQDLSPFVAIYLGFNLVVVAYDLAARLRTVPRWFDDAFKVVDNAILWVAVLVSGGIASPLSFFF